MDWKEGVVFVVGVTALLFTLYRIRPRYGVRIPKPDQKSEEPRLTRFDKHML